ncbi:MAG: sugar phosphate isomerase/epimerase family protein [Clostridiaceae bacterium]|nr:sugar phosphate isomerase/epimerase family protein [Clostridiaceae bacterium]
MKLGTLVRINAPAECTSGFEKLLSMGFTTCQLVYKPAEYHLEDAAFIRSEADRLGVEITAKLGGFHDPYNAGGIYAFLSSGFNALPFQKERLDYAMRSVEFTRALGITDNIFHAGYIPNNPLSQDYVNLVLPMKILTNFAKSVGANILYETGAESPISLLNLIADVGADNLLINFDTANCLLYGYGNPVDALYTFGPYIRNMHAKDGTPPNAPHSMGHETAIGEGEVDFPKVFERLHKLGYDGAVTIEREISGPQQESDIRRAAAYLRTLM